MEYFLKLQNSWKLSSLVQLPATISCVSSDLLNITEYLILIEWSNDKYYGNSEDFPRSVPADL